MKNTNGWYRQYQSVVQGVPTVGTECTAWGDILRPAVLHLLCQYLVSVFGDKNHAFPLGGRQTVVRAHRPAVGFVNEYLVAAHVNHRFDGERHARYYQHARAAFAEVLHVRLFVKLDTHAMPAKVAHHAVAVLLGMLLDGGAYVTEACPGLCGLYAYVTAFFGDLYQPCLLYTSPSPRDTR